MLPLLRRSAHPRIVNQSSHVGSLALQTTPGVDLGGISGAYTPTKTYLNGFSTQTPEQGAAIAIRLAALPDDGPTGRMFHDNGVVPW